MRPDSFSSSSGKIIYDTSRIWSVGHEIVKSAGVAQLEHDAYVETTLASYLTTVPPAVNGFPTIERLLSLHGRRLGQRNGSSQGLGSYDWQVQMGNTLKFIADGINEQEKNWSDSFKAKVPQ